MLRQNKKIVVHAVAISRYVHLLPDLNIAVVWMRRIISDIIASQERIGWTEEWEHVEKLMYDNPSAPISIAKYDFWDYVQKQQCKNVFEVEYESLCTHPLWIPKEKRVNFTCHQTK